jgi:hypothetical protein
VSEDDLLKAVLKLARLLGVMAAHFRPAQTQRGNWVTAVQGDGKGYPDLTLAGPGGVLFRELKSEKGPTSPEQKAWIGSLGEAGADVAVWRPADLRSGRIERELRLIGGQVAVAKSKPAWMK